MRSLLGLAVTCTVARVNHHIIPPAAQHLTLQKYRTVRTQGTQSAKDVD